MTKTTLMNWRGGKDSALAVWRVLQNGQYWGRENGEFHTFVYQAPYFETPIDFRIGETVPG